MHDTKRIYLCLFPKNATFSGRATRSDFWFITLFYVVITLLSVFFIFYAPASFIATAVIVALGITAAVNKRLHDLNFSGLLLLSIYAIWIISEYGEMLCNIAAVCCLPICISKGHNRGYIYGSDPLKEVSDVFE